MRWNLIGEFSAELRGINRQKKGLRKWGGVVGLSAIPESLNIRHFVVLLLA